MKTAILAFMILALGADHTLAGAPNSRVIAFNDYLVERLKESQAPFQVYWKALTPWYAGERLQREPVTDAFGRLRKTHQRIYGELLEAEVPEKEHCQEFYEAVMEYLAIDREIIAAYETAHKHIFEHNPATHRREIAYVEGVVNPVMARQEAVLERLALLQEKLASAHGFELREFERLNIAAAEDDAS